MRGRAAAAIAISALAMLAFAALPLQARTTASLKGSWSCCGPGGAGAQIFVITSTTSVLHGRATFPSGVVFAKITGSIHGRAVRIVTTYNGSAPGYVAVFTGTLASSGKKMSGSWKSNRSQSGTWTAARR
jgi:hypothetical protein